MADHDTAGEAYEMGGANHFMAQNIGPRGSAQRTRSLIGIAFGIESIGHTMAQTQAATEGRASAIDAARGAHATEQARAHGIDPNTIR